MGWHAATFIRPFGKYKNYYRMESKEQKGQHGGRRENSGRPRGMRGVPLCVRISTRASEYLEREVNNKSRFIDHLILKEFEGED